MEELKKEEGTVVPQEEVQEETPQCLHRFNAGAFVFSWIWGICNGVWGTLLLIIPYGGALWWLLSAVRNTDSFAAMLVLLIQSLAFAVPFSFMLGFLVRDWHGISKSIVKLHLNLIRARRDGQ